MNLPASVQQLTPEQSAALIQSTPDLVIVDLREDWELKAEGIIAGSQHIDYLNSKLFAESIAKLDPSKSYLFTAPSVVALSSRLRPWQPKDLRIFRSWPEDSTPGYGRGRRW